MSVVMVVNLYMLELVPAIEPKSKKTIMVHLLNIFLNKKKT